MLIVLERVAQEVDVAEVVVLILDLARPARGEQVFETATDGVAVRLAVHRDHSGALYSRGVVVSKSVTALGVQQRRTPGVADAAGHRAEALLVVAEHHATDVNRVGVAVQPAVLGFDTEHPVRGELPVVTTLHTAEERGVVVAGRASGNAVVADEGAADVTTDVETGPVVDRGRRNVSRGLGVGTRREVGGSGRGGEGDQRHGAEQELLHNFFSRTSIRGTAGRRRLEGT